MKIVVNETFDGYVIYADGKVRKEVETYNETNNL
jgi:hypothetical protein